MIFVIHYTFERKELPRFIAHSARASRVRGLEFFSFIVAQGSRLTMNRSNVTTVDIWGTVLDMA